METLLIIFIQTLPNTGTKMKNIPFFLIIISLVYSCSSECSKEHSRSYMANKDISMINMPDTVLGTHAIPMEISGAGRSEKEYFVVNAGDTSAFSCIMLQNNDTKRLSMLLQYSRIAKMPKIVSVMDTDAVDSSKVTNLKYRTLTLNEQIKELKFIMRSLSKKYHLGDLHYIRMPLGAFRPLALDITKKYTEQSGGNINKISNEEVRKLIAQSDMVVELEKMLLVFGIAIDKISISEIVYYAQRGGNATGALGTDAGQDKIIDGLIVFSLNPMK